MVHSRRDQFCWIILCLPHFFLSRIILKPQINLSETSFCSLYSPWYEGHLLWTSQNVPGWLLSLPSGGLSVWGCAHRLAFCRPSQCVLWVPKGTTVHYYIITVSLWGSPRIPFSFKDSCLSRKSPYKLHCWENSQRKFPFIPGMDWQTKWWVDSSSDTISDVGIHLEENIQNKKTFCSALWLCHCISHLDSIDKKWNHWNDAVKNASVQLSK